MELQPPAHDESNLELAQIIAEEIAAGGPITFARFMDLAVAHPTHGYYSASVDRIGTAGDFLTAPETHPIFGWLLARQVIECWELLGREPRLHICEEGAGRGTLATQIMDYINMHAPPGMSSVVYDLHDLNPDHVASLIQPDARPDGPIHLSVRAGGDVQFTGVVLANELLDALPFHRLRRHDGELEELWVDLADGWFVERPGPLSEHVAKVRIDISSLADGQIIEASPRVETWLRTLAQRLVRGFAIIVDYGYERRVLHEPGRFPKGSLKTYRRHEVGEDPYIHIGRQDITAHVDFSSVQATAVDAGLSLEGITTLAEFCAGLGLDELLLEIQSVAGDARSYISARNAALELLNPSGLGRFRVAFLSKGVDVEKSLRGLAFQMPGL